jgi:HSP20 family protein
MIFTKTTTQHPFFDFMEPIMNDTWDLPKFNPSSKVKETETGFDIKLAIPGIPSKDVSVEVDAAKSELYIEYAGEGNEFVTKFKKTYEIPTTIDIDSISVSVKHGILEVVMSRKEEVSRKKIF